MSYLRELLKTKRLELYTSLENAWTVANKEVFPVMYSTDESINSYPHSQNLEAYLNSILEPLKDLFDENSEIFLSPCELYCILMAILFHDLGRVKFEEGHGSFTKQYILNNYQRFNIPTEELADAIAEICEIHKPLEEYAIQPAAIMLDAGNGKVRIRELAGLLVLIDEMDTSYIRLKELYALDQPKYFSGKALFRNYIRGISYDPFTKAVYVSIDNKILENTEIFTIEKLNYILLKEGGKEKKITELSDDQPNGFFDFLTKELGFTAKERGVFKMLMDKKVFVEQRISPRLISDFRRKLETELDSFLPDESDRKKLLGKLVKLKNPKTSDEIFRKFYYYYNYYPKNFTNPLKDKINNTASQKWPLIVVLPLIIRAIKESETNSKRSIYLSRLGIYVENWLISYKEHLFDTDGNETIEPVLDFDFILNVLDSMWELSRNIYKEGWFSYNDLLNKVVRQGDIMLIKLAVQRIEIISREIAKSNGFPSCINYDNRKWCLIRKNGECMSLTEIKNQINGLKNNLNNI